VLVIALTLLHNSFGVKGIIECDFGAWHPVKKKLEAFPGTHFLNEFGIFYTGIIQQQLTPMTP